MLGASWWLKALAAASLTVAAAACGSKDDEGGKNLASADASSSAACPEPANYDCKGEGADRTCKCAWSDDDRYPYTEEQAKVQCRTGTSGPCSQDAAAHSSPSSGTSGDG